MPPVNNRSSLLGFPKSHAVVIGINDYPSINANLKSAVSDATRLAKVLKEDQGFDHVELLTNPKKAEIMDLLARIRDDQREPIIQPQDSLVFYYAGHGKAGEFDQGPAGYLLPSDARPQSAALDNDSLIKMEEVFDTLSQLDCHHTLLIFDCCFAGKFRYVGQKSRDTETPFFMPLYEERFEKYKRQKAWQVLVSAGPDQTAADWMGDRANDQSSIHSPFAKALFDSLEGKAEIKPKGKNLGDGVLTVQELFLYLWNIVEKKTNEDAKFPIQYPDLFPMGNHKGGQFIFFDPKNKLNFANRVERNPYKGLHPYSDTDNDLFFGRKKAVEELYDKIQKTEILVVTAPSGLGKSSVVRAGIWPMLKEKEEFEQCFVIRPGNLPTEQLNALETLDPQKKQLLVVDQYEELFTETEDPKERKAFEKEMVRILGQARTGNLKIILTIRSDFEWQLGASDFGKEFWNTEALYSFLYRLAPLNLDELREVLVNPAWVEAFDFESEDLVDNILQEVNYAPGALPLLSFTMGELYRITDKDKRIFTWNNYHKKIGGVNGALSKRADEIYTSLSSEQQKMMRALMLRMVRLNDGSFSRRRVINSADPVQKAKGLSHELDFPNDEQDQILAKVVQALGESLLVHGKDKQGHSYIEPIHDSLINYWPTCLQWIQDFGKDSILLQRQLWQAVQDLFSTDDYTQNIIAQDASSALWDKSPKLQQVLQLILDPHDKWLCHVPESSVNQIFFLLWEDQPSEAQLNLLLPWKHKFEGAQTAEDVFRAIQKGMDNWLNLNELQFVRKSWERRESQIAQLKRQRDEARASALAAQSLLNRSTDPTLSLNLARVAYKMAPGEESARALSEGLSNPNIHFYRKKVRHNPENIIHDSPVPIPEAINSVDVSPDLKFLVTDGTLGGLKVWDLEGTLLHSYEGQEDENGSTYYSLVKFLPDSKRILAMKGYSGESFVWDPESGSVRPFPKSPERIVSALHSGNGNSMFIKFQEAGFWEWDPDSDQLTQLNENPGFWEPPADLPTGENKILAPDGDRICTYSGDFIRVDEREGDFCFFDYKEADPANKYINSVSFLPGGEYLVSAHKDGYARFWQIENRRVRDFSEPGKEIHYAFLTQAGIVFFVEFLKGNAYGRDFQENPICWLPKLDNTGFEIIACQSLEKGIFTINSYNNGLASDICRWNASGELEKRIVDPHKDRIFHLKIKPGSQFFFTCGNSSKNDSDHNIIIWDWNLNHIRTITAPQPINYLTIAPDGNCIAAIAGQQHLFIWSWEGEVLHSYDFGEDSDLGAIAISPDNMRLAASGNDRKIYLLNLENLTLQKSFDGQAGGLKFSSDGKYLYGDFGSIKVWDQEGRMLLALSDNSSLGEMVLTPDEQFFQVISGNHNVGRCKAQLWKNPIWELEQGLIDGLDELERERFGIDF